MRLPRMTTRRWMIAVAVVAVMPDAAAALFRRHLSLRERAAYHEKIEKLATATVGELALAARWPKADRPSASQCRDPRPARPSQGEVLARRSLPLAPRRARPAGAREAL